MRTQNNGLNTVLNCVAPVVATSQFLFKEGKYLEWARIAALLLNLSEIQVGALRLLTPAKSNTGDAMEDPRISPFRTIALLSATYCGAVIVSKITKEVAPVPFAFALLVFGLCRHATARTHFYTLNIIDINNTANALSVGLVAYQAFTKIDASVVVRLIQSYVRTNFTNS